jgi:hypothetical protein
MSLSFANAVITGLLHNKIPVKYHVGWEKRGNGQTSAYQGLIWHHTATNYLNDPPSILWDGRPDLDGPLCNSSGNADGSVTIIAANPANHAGASGGKSMGPLPRTNTFNKCVWGHEIVYPGDKPMTPAQYHAALVLGGVISGILKRPTAEWCRGHAETSVTGKWDPGYAPGKTVDLNAMRRDVWPALFMEAGDMPLSDDDLSKIASRVWQFGVANKFPDKKLTQAQDMLGWIDLRAYNVAASAGRIETALQRFTPSAVAALPTADLQVLAQAVCDEMDRRTRIRLEPATMGKV